MAGPAQPVAVVGAGSVDNLSQGISGSYVGTMRPFSVGSVNIDSSAVSPTIDKRGFGAIGVVIPADFSGTKLRFEVSVDGSVWGLLIRDSAVYEETLVASVINAVMCKAEIYPFPYARIRFVDDSGDDVNQSDLTVTYSLIA